MDARGKDQLERLPQGRERGVVPEERAPENRMGVSRRVLRVHPQEADIAPEDAIAVDPEVTPDGALGFLLGDEILDGGGAEVVADTAAGLLHPLPDAGPSPFREGLGYCDFAEVGAPWHCH